MSLFKSFALSVLLLVLLTPDIFLRPAAAQVTRSQPSCRVPDPPENAKIVDLSSSGYSSTLSNVTIAGQTAQTGALRIEILPQAKPLYLVLSSKNITIWDIQGATNDIAQVVIGGPPDTAGKIQAGITGIPAEKVVFISTHHCLGGMIAAIPKTQRPQPGYTKELDGPYRWENIDSEGVLSPNRDRRITLPVMQAPRRLSERSPLRITIGDQVIFEKAQNLPYMPPPVGFDSRIWDDFLKDTPGGFLDMKGKTIVTPMTAENYRTLPGWAGFGQLLMEKKLEIDEARTARASFGRPHFRIIQEIKELPAMSKGQRLTISLALGVPPPQSINGDVCIESEETGAPIKGLCQRIDNEEKHQALLGNTLLPPASAPATTPERPVNHQPLIVPEPYISHIQTAYAQQKDSKIRITPPPPRYLRAAAGEDIAFAAWGDNGNGSIGRFSSAAGSYQWTVWSDEFNRFFAQGRTPIQFNDSPSCFLLESGAVWCVQGFLREGSAARQTNTLALKQVEGLPAMKSIDSHGLHGTCGLDGNNRYWCWNIPKARTAHPYYPSWWRDNFTSDSPFPFIFQSMIKLEANASQSCLLNDRGAVWCWGEKYRNNGEYSPKNSIAADFPIPVPLTKTAIDISSSDFVSCAHLADKTAQCWKPQLVPKPFTFFEGDANNNQGDITVREVKAGWQEACAIKNADGSVWCVDLSSVLGSSFVYEQIKDINGAPLLNITALTGGTNICALDASRRLWCWKGDKANDSDTSRGGIFASLMLAPESREPLKNVLFTSTGYSNVVALSRPKNQQASIDAAAAFINAVIENRLQDAQQILANHPDMGLSARMAEAGVLTSINRNDPVLLKTVFRAYRGNWEKSKLADYLTEKVLKQERLNNYMPYDREEPPHPDILLILLEGGLVFGRTPGENTRVLNILEKTYSGRPDAASLLEKIQQLKTSP